MMYINKGNKKGTIFCIHGNSSSARVFQKLLQSDLVMHSKIAIDLKGHGDNQSTDYVFNDMTFESQKQFIIDELSKVNDEILLVGNSLGGHLAIEVAQEISNLKGLVIMGTPPLKKPINFDEAFIPIEEMNVYFSECPSEEEINKAATISLYNKSKAKHVSIDFTNTNPLARAAIMADISQNKLLDQFEIFTQLNVPKYIIAGDRDLSINRAYLESVKNSCLNNCEIVNFKNCGHFPGIDNPGQFVRVIGNIASKIFS